MNTLYVFTCLLLVQHAHSIALAIKDDLESTMLLKDGQNSENEIITRDVIDKAAKEQSADVRSELNTHNVFDKLVNNVMLRKPSGKQDKSKDADIQNKENAGSENLLGVRQSRKKRSLMLFLYDKLGSKELFRLFNDPEAYRHHPKGHKHRHGHGKHLNRKESNGQKQKRKLNKLRILTKHSSAPLFVG